MAKTVRLVLGYLFVISLGVTFYSEQYGDAVFSSLYLFIFSGAALILHSVLQALRRQYKSILVILGTGIPAAFVFSVLSDAHLFKTSILTMLKG